MRLLIIIFILISACSHSPKDFTCKLYNKNISVCESKNNVRAFFDTINDNIVGVGIDSSLVYEIRFYNDVNHIRKLILHEYDKEYGISIFFDLDGNITEMIKQETSHNEKIVVKRNNYSFDFEVYSYLKNKDMFKITSYVHIDNNGDSTKYFYYSKTPSGFHINTNVEVYDLNNPNLDSMDICFIDTNLETIKFDNSEDAHTYYPIFGERLQYRTLNTHDLITDKNELIGMLWGNFNKKASAPYSYALLYMHGDLSRRLKEFTKEMVKIRKEYSSLTLENKQISKILIDSKIFYLKNGKLKRSDLTYKIGN